MCQGRTFGACSFALLVRGCVVTALYGIEEVQSDTSNGREEHNTVRKGSTRAVGGKEYQCQRIIGYLVGAQYTLARAFSLEDCVGGGGIIGAQVRRRLTDGLTIFIQEDPSRNPAFCSRIIVPPTNRT
ncbi:hypothetical protein ONS96_010691 [Cadophora gregata f. sp. sojae]|nr:hypothetical protein ONS96_010691 [Cadophora gregata f. sp. sojae]